MLWFSVFGELTADMFHSSGTCLLRFGPIISLWELGGMKWASCDELSDDGGDGVGIPIMNFN